MKRTLVRIEELAEWKHLCKAAYLAARGKRQRDAVSAFFSSFDASIYRLSEDLLKGRAPGNHYESFTIHDPKQRTIHAACFNDRVLHHAIIGLTGDVLDRRLVATSYACRIGKGCQASARHVQSCLQKYPWFVKIDIDGYFASISHRLLFSLLCDVFKGQEFLALLDRIIGGFQTGQGIGLPIGSLTSQHFANYYLSEFDHRLLAKRSVKGHCRYMDDSIWWCGSRTEARETLAWANQWLPAERGLVVKASAQINRSAHGVNWCGYRIKPGQILPSRRRLRRYQQRRLYWEQRWCKGEISDLQLQQCYAGVKAILDGTVSDSWRQNNLILHPPPCM